MQVQVSCSRAVRYGNDNCGPSVSCSRAVGPAGAHAKYAKLQQPGCGEHVVVCAAAYPRAAAGPRRAYGRAYVWCRVRMLFPRGLCTVRSVGVLAPACGACRQSGRRRAAVFGGENPGGDPLARLVRGPSGSDRVPTVPDRSRKLKPGRVACDSESRSILTPQRNSGL